MTKNHLDVSSLKFSTFYYTQMSREEKKVGKKNYSLYEISMTVQYPAGYRYIVCCCLIIRDVFSGVDALLFFFVCFVFDFVFYMELYGMNEYAIINVNKTCEPIQMIQNDDTISSLSLSLFHSLTFYINLNILKSAFQC